MQEGLLDTNPVAGTGKADEGGSRERLLTPEELRKLWRALGDDPFSDVVRLLLLTGQRRNEIGKLTWAEVDLARKMIVLAPERTKNSRPHEVPLSAQALAQTRLMRLGHCVERLCIAPKKSCQSSLKFA